MSVGLKDKRGLLCTDEAQLIVSPANDKLVSDHNCFGNMPMDGLNDLKSFFSELVNLTMPASHYPEWLNPGRSAKSLVHILHTYANTDPT